MPESSTKVEISRSNGEVVAESYVGKGSFLIGRDDECAIQIGEDDPHVSRKHALLIISDKRVEIEDLDSTSGTFLGGIPLKGRVIVFPGMKVHISNLFLDIHRFGVDELVEGTRLGSGRFILTRKIGKGGLGDVWEAYDEDENEKLAIKLIHSALDLKGNGARDLQREVKRSHALDHPNIIGVGYFWNLKDEPPFITLEYVEGQDLEYSRLEYPDGLLPWYSVQHYIVQLCKALRYAHGHELAHRDIKPSNLLIDEGDSLKLADFGFAASLSKSSRMSSAITFGGTPHYCSPQQLRGEQPQATDDIYSVGATIYDLLTGTPPFYQGDIYRNVIHEPAKPMEDRLHELSRENDIPDYVAAMVMSCLHKNPAMRPQNARILQQWIQSEGHDIMLDAQPLQIWGDLPEEQAQQTEPVFYSQPQQKIIQHESLSAKIAKQIRQLPLISETSFKSTTIAAPNEQQPVQAIAKFKNITTYSFIGLIFVALVYVYFLLRPPSKTVDIQPPKLNSSETRRILRGSSRASFLAAMRPNSDGSLRFDIRGLKRRPFHASGRTKIPPGSVIWEFQSEGFVSSTPAIGNDGTVYVGSNDNAIYALDGKTGAKKWTFQTSGSIWFSSPAIGADGTVYIGSMDGKIYALDGNKGVKQWEFKTGAPVISSPAVGVDGTVYVGSGDNKAYALDGKTGEKKWEFETNSDVESSPAIGADGTVYVGSLDNKIYALDGKTGARKWEFETGSYVPSSPAIGDDGTVYIGSSDEKIYALDGKTGVKKWEFLTAGKVSSSPAIGSDGTVYAVSINKKVYALDGTSGTVLWEFETMDNVWSSPAIGSDGIVYIGSDDKKIYALDSKTGAKKWEFETGKPVKSSPTIGADGTIYVGSGDKKIYAIMTDSKGPARSPWPMRSQNAKHSGRTSEK